MLIHLHEMDAISVSLCDYVDEDYIEMELSSSPSSILCCSTNSSPQSREFEFQMSITCNDKETTISPADELFYKGKLLPLYIQTSTSTTTTTTTTYDITKEAFEEDDYYSIPFPTCSTAPCTNTLNTPLDSCNISPSESCRVSCELHPDDYFFEWSNELNTFINNHHPTKMTWSKKLKLIKLSILGQKLKASRAYLKSLFSKSACYDESCAKANCNAGGAQSLPKADDKSSNKYFKIAKKKPFGQSDIASYPTIATIMNNIDKEGVEENVQRRSFSSAIKRHSPTKCLSSSSSNSSSGASSSSSSFSLNSNGYHHELYFLRRSSSATEIESSIEAAIAHCKKSQRIFDSRNSSRELGICSLSASRITDEEDPKRPGLCSI